MSVGELARGQRGQGKAELHRFRADNLTSALSLWPDTANGKASMPPLYTLIGDLDRILICQLVFMHIGL